MIYNSNVNNEKKGDMIKQIKDGLNVLVQLSKMLMCPTPLCLTKKKENHSGKEKRKYDIEINRCWFYFLYLLIISFVLCANYS